MKRGMITAQLVNEKTNEFTSERVTAEIEAHLAVHRGLGEHKSTWSITHIPTGRCVAWFYYKALALGCMIELSHSMNWKDVEYTPECQEVAKPVVLPILERWLAIQKQERTEVANV